ncbi:MAG: hypothetical protein IT228_05750 [Flavobacteriales bacterium]|nr:hypothetical protein [Flavobacteriales bacterium]MCC6576828.1 hypothetical protein [Flavobacteriales bacterium]NUQ14044.1 hypothetical protein [Flavobacteriales bacterium]
MPDRRLTLLFVAVLAPLGTFAAVEAPSWLADTLYASGRMYAVIAVVAVVLLGLAAWMAAFDRRLSRLERHHRDTDRNA